MGKKIKVVFDTNVWISIFMEDILYDKFSHVRDKLTIYVSKDIILELSRVLLYPRVAKVLDKNGISEKDVLRVILTDCKMVESKMQLRVVKADEEDNKILDCALSARADVIVSGDRHLLDLGKFRKTRILTPKEFFEGIT